MEVIIKNGPLLYVVDMDSGFVKRSYLERENGQLGSFLNLYIPYEPKQKGGFDVAL